MSHIYLSIAPPSTMANNDHWIYPYSSQHQSYFVAFMSWFHGGVECPRDERFTKDEVLEIQPEDVCRWFRDEAHGDPEPNHEPTTLLLRSSTLEQRKKAISHYMPAKHPHVNGAGNPTRHSSVNNIISKVKRLECRGLGVDSQAKRPLREPEFRKTMGKNACARVKEKFSRGRVVGAILEDYEMRLS